MKSATELTGLVNHNREARDARPPAALSEIEFPRCSCVWVYAVQTDKWVVVVVGVVAIAELGALLPLPSLPPTDK